MIVGDFNCLYQTWGENISDQREKIIMEFIEENELTSFNDRSITIIYPNPSKYSSMIDIRLSREPMENHKELMQQKPPKGHPHKDHTQKKSLQITDHYSYFKKPSGKT